MPSIKLHASNLHALLVMTSLLFLSSGASIAQEIFQQPTTYFRDSFGAGGRNYFGSNSDISSMSGPTIDQADNPYGIFPGSYQFGNMGYGSPFQSGGWLGRPLLGGYGGYGGYSGYGNNYSFAPRLVTGPSGFGGLPGYGGYGSLVGNGWGGYNNFAGYGPGYGNYGGAANFNPFTMNPFTGGGGHQELGIVRPTAAIQSAPSKSSGNYYQPSTVDSSASGSYYASASQSQYNQSAPAAQKKEPWSSNWTSPSGSSDLWGSGGTPFPKDLNSVPWNR